MRQNVTLCAVEARFAGAKNGQRDRMSHLISPGDPESFGELRVAEKTKLRAFSTCVVRSGEARRGL